MALLDDTQTPHHTQWDAILRAPIVETECAFVDGHADNKAQIVVIYNARNAPPVVTIDAEHDQSAVFTLRADGAPLAVLSCGPDSAPSPEDVMLVARHASN